MIIDGNLKEKKAMESFHRGDRKEGLRLQEDFVADFRKEYKEKDHCSCKKLVDTTEIVKNVLQYIELIKNMCQIVCVH